MWAIIEKLDVKVHATTIIRKKHLARAQQKGKTMIKAAYFLEEKGNFRENYLYQI